LAAAVNAIGFPNASQWTYDDIESRRSRLAALSGLYDTIGRFDAEHPWWGFQPKALAPSDDETIGRIVLQALEQASNADVAADEAVSLFGLRGQCSATVAGNLRTELDRVPPISESADPSLLHNMFNPDSDPEGQRSSRLLSDVSAGVSKARRLFESASRMLSDGERLSLEVVHETEILARGRLSSVLISSELSEAIKLTARFERVLETFVMISQERTVPYGPAGKRSLEAFLANCAKTAALGLAPFTIKSLEKRAAAVMQATEVLSGALARVDAIASRKGLSFDSTPDSVAKLADPSGIQGFRKDARIDAKTLDEARHLVAFPLADKSIQDIEHLKSLLEAETSACADALARCRAAVERLGLAFDSTERAVAEAHALSKIAAAAPEDLLEYRRPTFGYARTTELVERIRSSIALEHDARTSLDSLFYLDALPLIPEMRSAVATLRRKDGFFAFIDGEWRKSRQLHAGLSKEKRKARGKQRADELAALVAWIEAKDAFVSDSELKECFGALFCGLGTDSEKIIRLNQWYQRARAALLECPGLVEKVDLSNLASERILELSAKAAAIQADVRRLTGAEATVRNILGANVAGFRDAKAKGWDDGLKCLGRAVDSLGIVAEFFSGRMNGKELSPKQVLRLMEARAALDAAAPDLALLLRGKDVVREAGGDELGGLADLVGGRWTEAIASISTIASLVTETVGQARAFAGEDAPLSVAESFARAKADLDDAWGKVTHLPAWNRFDGWPALREAAESDVVIARKVLERLVPCARVDASLEEVLSALSEEAEARAILDRLAGSTDVHRILGGAFKGADTNLDQLSQTHAWGDAVCTLDLPIAIRRRLLSDDARSVLETSCRLYKNIDAGCRGAKDALESLSAYGSFSWEEWQRQARSEAARDLPSEIKGRLETALYVPGSVLPWSKYLSLKQQCGQESLADFVVALESAKIPSAALASAFELAAYQSIGRSIYQTYPELSGFNGSAHEKTRSDYTALDTEIVSLTGCNFASQIGARVPPKGQRGATVGEYTEMHLLRREINKQRRHIPIRQLVKRAGRALQELKPCFMMGPLSVAQYLEQGALRFDLIVMDEASQLRPEESLGAIARGSQLVVVGDPKQLPPTSFFDRMLDSGDDEEEDDAPAAITGMESILDICQQLFTPVRSLRWHYRSHHESLIAFSNHHFYKNLIVFPSPYAKNPGLGVKYRYVSRGSYKDRQNIPEAQRLVDAVLDHMMKWPDESLGVVTLNQTQRELIEELLDKKLKTFHEGTSFIERWEAEGWPFFIKNLENVQGDERDVIFISTTFGKAPGTDKVRQNFGPISRPDGWRRLNVLFTRSKRRIELFTSMAPEDIIVDERTPQGTKALRDYLDFAKRGVLVTTDDGERPPDSDFEVSVANVIRSLGYEVKPQLGVAGFFIDMVVRNPERPGEFLAGIECDGATYHSGFSVRDRDRIRQQILESLGWKGRMHRIWSTDWFYNPRREAGRLVAFLEERRRLSLNEHPVDQEEEDDYAIETNESNGTEGAIEADVVDALSASSSTDDLFVEVGDHVTYCMVDSPNDRHSVRIVESPGNAKMYIINEHTPLAVALLGLSTGDTGELDVPGQKVRQLRVLKIQRQEELLA
jgi:transcription elongation GreA/GreB family factor